MSAIDRRLADLPETQRGLVERLRTIVRAEAPGLVEGLKWGYPTCSGRDKVLSIVPHRDHVNLQVHRGAELRPRFSALEGTGKRLRHVKLRSSEPLEEGLVRALIRAAAGLDAVAEADHAAPRAPAGPG